MSGPSTGVAVSVIRGDAISFDADVLALKYAQFLHGVDRLVYTRLSVKGRLRLPAIGHSMLYRSDGTVGAKAVFFVGVKPLTDFGYQEIREFATSVLASLLSRAPETRRLALTLHGAGYGLDETEAFRNHVTGVHLQGYTILIQRLVGNKYRGLGTFGWTIRVKPKQRTS